eukprot:CAMPEP_0168607952 /NCGR_PEP_ID=MMETSP0449_2-20121227/357_1 /TAXON_ID=1082188 /ORGANISM="Strombidium rassoulzadegani, Strain ras09" /LENGTH=135 /DNA_ID=CAMNT_0008647883 /DNA_START=571 /DNA_END=979 /DNA_ORIENTATION=+
MTAESLDQGVLGWARVYRLELQLRLLVAFKWHLLPLNSLRLHLINEAQLQSLALADLLVSEGALALIELLLDGEVVVEQLSNGLAGRFESAISLLLHERYLSSSSGVFGAVEVELVGASRGGVTVVYGGGACGRG